MPFIWRNLFSSLQNHYFLVFLKNLGPESCFSSYEDIVACDYFWDYIWWSKFTDQMACIMFEPILKGN